MTDTHETIADIIAEIRALSNTISDGIIAINGKSIANRIEAAHKRESGDSVKLREAAVIVYDVLEKLRPFSLCLRDVGCMREFNHLVCLAKNRLDAALSAPPRNCERFQTTKQAKEAYFAEVRHVSVWDGCETERLVDWLLAHVTEK